MNVAPVSLLPHQLVLLLLDPNSGAIRHRQDAELAVTAAVLAELAMQERIHLDARTLTLIDDRPTGEAILDERLSALAPRRTTGYQAIFGLHRAAALKHGLSDAVAAGWLQQTSPSRFLLPARFRLTDVNLVAPLRQAVANTLAAPQDATQRDACLAGLACEAGMLSELGRDMARQQRWAAQRVLRRRDWAVDITYKMRMGRAVANVAAAG